MIGHVNNGNGNTGGFGGVLSLVITGSAGDLTSTFLGTNGGAGSVTTSQTERAVYNLVDLDTGTENGATHTWTLAVNDHRAIVGANFVAASSTPTPSPPSRLLLGIGT